MPRTPIKRAVDEYFNHENNEFSCVHCSLSFKGGQLRRKLEHLLNIGTAVVGCAKREEISETEMKGLMSEYDELN